MVEVEAERAGAVWAVNTFPHRSPSLSLFTIPLQNIIQHSTVVGVQV